MFVDYSYIIRSENIFSIFFQCQLDLPRFLLPRQGFRLHSSVAVLLRLCKIKKLYLQKYNDIAD